MMNEGECFVEGREAAIARGHWKTAAARVNCPSMITVGKAKGRWYIGYHHTLSELDPEDLVSIGKVTEEWYCYPLCLDVRLDGGEVYLTFFTPVAKYQWKPKEWKKWFLRCDNIVKDCRF